MRYLVVFGIVALVACTPPTNNRTVAILTVAETCQAYASALRILAAHRAAGRLSDDEVEKVTLSHTMADAICLGPPPLDATDAAIKVANQVAVLMLIVSSKEQQ